MRVRRRSLWWVAWLTGMVGGSAEAQLSTWKLGGSGLAWSGSDTISAMIDFAAGGKAIQPVHIRPDQNIIQLIHTWAFRREPREIGFVNGEWPRVWKWNNGTGEPTENGIFLVDGDSATYNVPKAEEVEQQFFTIDLAVPVPAEQFGFFTPSGGFRSNGRPLREDAVPAYQVSIQEENSELFDQKGPLPLEKVIAEVGENFNADVRIRFPRQYVRFVRYARKLSILDEEDLNRCGEAVAGEGLGRQIRRDCAGQGNLAVALKGTVADFELYGEGAPKRAIYKTKIAPLGPEQNFGRLFFAATPMRLVNGEAVETPQAEAWVEIEVRTGRDEDPNLYHEFTITGEERVVSRQRYENELLERLVRRCTLCDPEPRKPKPGLRASVGYDSENWSFWSSPITRSGSRLDLRSGAYIQVKVTLQSRKFSDFVRLDSVWVERAPLLAEEVIGEVALLDDPRPARGFTRVNLGESTDFVCDIRARFAGEEQAGFDAVRLRLGTRAQFGRLEMGEPLAMDEPPERISFAPVEPANVVADEDGLLVWLPERVAPGHNRPLRLVFAAQVFELAGTFQGEVLDAVKETLPQSIAAGDVTEEISTNSLRVFAEAETGDALLPDLRLSTRVLTPNGDGINDQVEIAYELFRLPEEVPVELEVYTLDGRRAATLAVGQQAAGPQQLRWDGRDQDGALLAPGTYLLRVAVRSQFAGHQPVRPVGIAY
jgi:hypothetical protein